MKTILAGVGVGVLLGACGTSQPLPQASTNLLLASAGVYQGTLSTRAPVTLLTLYDGTAYLFYQKPIAGVVVVTNGKQAGDGQFKGDSATQFSLRPNAMVSPVQVQIDFSHSPAVKGVIEAGEGSSAPLTFSATPEQMLGLGPTLATIAGAYKGRLTSLQGSTNSQVVIVNDGLLAGTTSSGCEFRGSVSPAGGVDAYNMSVTFSSTPCVAPNATVTGHAVLNDGRLLIALPKLDRSDVVVFEGAR